MKEEIHMKRFSAFLLTSITILALVLGFLGAEPPMVLARQSEPYRDAKLPVEQRVKDLLGRMTLDEKIGQMTLVQKNAIKGNDIADQFIGALLSGGGETPSINAPAEWAKMVQGFQQQALKTRLGIPLIYGIDAVHGHNNVVGAVIYPHNIGLGATGDADLVERIGRATAEEMIATDIRWDYAPVVAVAQDIRWGRIYESYSENTALVTKLSSAFIKGLQGSNLSDPTSVLATPKHFIGDGGTTWGSSKSNNYEIDQGDTQVDMQTLRTLFLPPYTEAVKSGAKSIMISFSSWNGLKMHAQKGLITDLLKGELGFKGFTVSDWGGIDQISFDYYQAVVTAINAGVDMNMVPANYSTFIHVMQQAVQKGDISMSRIDDAVGRILTVKFELGLFEKPNSDNMAVTSVGSDAHRALAREAVSKSLVLLQNNNQALPIAKDAPQIIVAGAADDIGVQSGGWTITWQGAPGKTTPGTTILEGIKNGVSKNTTVTFNASGNFDDLKDSSGNALTADVGIVVIAEPPYAEGLGDRGDLSLGKRDIDLIQTVRERSKKLVVILVSGRPLIITDQLKTTDAFVAAWLPGTEGEGVADVLFGDKQFTGKLPFTWVRSTKQLPLNLKNAEATGCDGPLFPFGYGLDTTKATPTLTLDCN
jgi:beta-glucosidase